MDPVDLYGYMHASSDTSTTSPYATQFMYRVNDAIDKFHPDVVYFDDHVGDSQVDLGVHMGLASIATTTLANYYNKSLTWNQGKMDVVMNMKGVGGQYDSFQKNEALLPFAQRALVRSTEASTEPQISAYPFQTELTIQDWHYQTRQAYTDATGARFPVRNFELTVPLFGRNTSCHAPIAAGAPRSAQARNSHAGRNEAERQA
jgi:alpha-L-fucosidase-like protein